MELAQLKAAIQEFFGDTSRSPEETRDGLEEAAADIETLLDVLPKEE